MRALRHSVLHALFLSGVLGAYLLDAEIAGTFPAGQFGWSLLLNSPQQLVVGANNAGGPGGGLVQLFSRGESSPPWTPSALLLPPLPNASSPLCFGGAAYGAGVHVAPRASPPLLVTGVFTSYESQGGAAVYAGGSSGSNWSLAQQICAMTPGGEFGSSSALSEDGTWLMIGAPNDGDAGTVVVYMRSGGGGTPFALLSALAPPAAVSLTAFGASVAIAADGALLAIGAVAAGDSAGRVLLYRPAASLTGAPSWALAGVLAAPGGGTADDGFGKALSLSAASTAGGGQPRELLIVGGDGAAYAFTSSHISPATAATPLPNPSAVDGFGWSVASFVAPAGALAIAAVGCNDALGSVALFSAMRPQNGSAWEVLQTLTPPAPPQRGDFFGLAVAISADGATLAVGAPLRAQGNGSAFVFTQAGACKP